MNALVVVATLFLMALNHQVLASEIDSFTKRYEPLPDVSLGLDNLANKHLQEALTLANQKPGCDKEKLYEALREHFQIILAHGKFMEELMSSEQFTKRAIPRIESIYKYHGKTDGYLLVRPAADRDGIGMGAMVQYGEFYIGTDKFEHIFGRGYLYFSKFIAKGKTVRSALERSMTQERYFLGGMRFETGVFSYADLVANFNGMRFWNDFLKEFKDPLDRELSPVLKCENSKWIINRPLSFAQYIDSGFDEAINCIQTATQNGALGVKASLMELQMKDRSHRYKCPLDMEKHRAIQEKYGAYTKWLINPGGIKQLD